MNPNDLFWLARYAFNAVNPLVKSDERLIIHLNFANAGRVEGVDIWVHKLADGEVVAFQTGLTRWQDVEAVAATLKPQEAVSAA